MIKEIKTVITIMETWTKCFLKVTEAHRMGRCSDGITERG